MEKKPISQSTTQRRISEQASTVDTKAKPMATVLESFFRRYAKDYLRKQTERLIGKVRKSTSEEEYRKELWEILYRYGINTISEAGEEEVTLYPEQLDREPAIVFFQQVSNQWYTTATDLLDDSKKMLNLDINNIVAEMMRQSPQPSPGAIARRIQQASFKQDNELYAFSPVRASVIARTETGIAQNQGTALSYMETGDVEDEVQWMARHGEDHRHGDLDGETITIADQLSSDTSRWFNGPLIKPMRYPQDPQGDVGDIVHCMCAIRKISRKLL